MNNNLIKKPSVASRVKDFAVSLATRALDFAASVLDRLAKGSLKGTPLEHALGSAASWAARKSWGIASKLGLTTVQAPAPVDVITVFTAALTGVANASATQFWANPELQTIATATLSVLSAASDRQGHNDKVDAFVKEQVNIIAVLQSILPLVHGVKIRKDFSDEFNSIDTSHLNLNGFKHYWDQCYSLEITLNHGCGSIIINNIGHAANRYNVLSNSAALVSAAMAIANLYYIIVTMFVPQSFTSSPTITLQQAYNVTLGVAPSGSPATSTSQNPNTTQTQIFAAVQSIPFRLIV